MPYYSPVNPNWSTAFTVAMVRCKPSRHFSKACLCGASSWRNSFFIPADLSRWLLGKKKPLWIVEAGVRFLG